MIDLSRLEAAVMTEDAQGLAERLVFRVLDVDHKDYQAAMDGFVAICEQAGAARVLLAGTPILVCERHWTILWVGELPGRWPERCSSGTWIDGANAWDCRGHIVPARLVLLKGDPT